MRVGAWVDLAADLGNPKADVPVHEHREREAELVAVERSLRFADHDGIETTIFVLERLKEP